MHRAAVRTLVYKSSYGRLRQLAVYVSMIRTIGNNVLNKTDTAYRPLRTSVDLSGDAVTIRRKQPPPDLSPYLIEFWEYDVDPKLDYVPIQVFPSGCVVLRFNVTSQGVEPVLYAPSLNNNMKGLFFHEWIIFGVALRPNMAYQLLGISLHELRDMRINMECFWPVDVRRACEQIAGATSFAERITVFTKFLRKIFREDVTPNSGFLNVFQDITLNAQRASDIGMIAKRHGANGRSLRRHFIKYLGVGPKQMDRLVRVQNSMRQIQHRPSQSLASLSAGYKFSDQAHFSREFRSFVGFSPKVFASLVGSMHKKSLDIWSGMTTDYRHKVPPKILRFE